MNKILGRLFDIVKLFDSCPLLNNNRLIVKFSFGVKTLKATHLGVLVYNDVTV